MAGDRLKGRRTLAVSDFLDEFEKDDIKKGVDIVALFGHFGVSLAKKGKGYMGKCPWHDDSTPSLSVDSGKGLYNCFGCGESGDIFTLVEKMKGLTFRESVAYLKEFASTPRLNLAASRARAGQENNTDTKDTDGSTGENAGRDAEPADSLTAPDGDEGEARAVTGVTLDTVADWYHRRLFENTSALDYLKGRGLSDTRLLTRFKVGVADGSILEKISSAQSIELQAQGIITDKGAEHFQGLYYLPYL